MLKQIRRNAEPVGIICIILALALLVLIVVLNLADKAPSLEYLGIVLGLLSVGLGGIAIGLSEKSDARMEAMANLEFDAKISVLLDYAESAEKWENIFYGARAALRLEQWTSKTMKSEFKRVFEMVKRQAVVDKDADLENKLDGLWKEYHIESW